MEFVPSLHREAEPLPMPESPEDRDDDQEYNLKRIWLGNIDPSLSEYVVLKLLQPHGHLQKLDVVYHKEGPDKGKPKGFCFATYGKDDEAAKAIKTLHNYKLNGRKLIARVANSQRKAGSSQPRPQLKAASHYEQTDQSKAEKIAALEAKLAHMESQDPDRLQRKLVQSVKLAPKHGQEKSLKTQSKHTRLTADRKPYKR